MTIDAQAIIRKAQIDLLDEAGTRWPARELVSHLNDAVRALVVARPDITTTTTAVALVAGARQALPAQAALLVDIPCNAAGKKRAISKVDQLLLQRVLAAISAVSAWHAFHWGVSGIAQFMSERLAFQRLPRRARASLAWALGVGASIVVFLSLIPVFMNLLS